jgi:Concanavalin A-like lectin/glucanases superfamily
MKKFILLTSFAFLFTQFSFSQSIQIHLSDGSVRTFVISQIDSMTFSDVTPPEGLVAYYPFSGNADDYSGYDNNGTVAGATLTTDRHGNTNSAYSFNGSNNYIEIQDNTSLRPGSITIAAWVYPKITGQQGIVYKSVYADATEEEYALEINASGQLNGGIKRNSGCAAGVGWNNVTSTQTISLNQWTFVCLTWDGTTLKAYINGSSVAANTSVSSGSIDNCSGGTLRIGIEWQNDQAPFNGKLDDLRLYNRALSEQEILSLYNE